MLVFLSLNVLQVFDGFYYYFTFTFIKLRQGNFCAHIIVFTPFLFGMMTYNNTW
jgi:hypothetical protein